MRHALACLAVLIPAACGGGSKDATDPVYAYDEDEPIAKQDAGLANSDYPVKIHDITFDGGAERVPAFLLVPPGEGLYPAVIYLHGQGGDWLGDALHGQLARGPARGGADRRVPLLPNREIELGRCRGPPEASGTEPCRAWSSCDAPSTCSSRCRRWTTTRSAWSATAPVLARGDPRRRRAQDQGVRPRVGRRGPGRTSS